MRKYMMCNAKRLVSPSFVLRKNEDTGDSRVSKLTAHHGALNETKACSILANIAPPLVIIHLDNAIGKIDGGLPFPVEPYGSISLA